MKKEIIPMTQILCIMGIFYKYAYVFCASIFSFSSGR